MTELLERLEAADGPCRELDAEIALLVAYANCRLPDKNARHGLPIENQYGHGFYPRAYTSSIDAALTLADGNESDVLARALELAARAKTGKSWVKRFPQFVCIAALKAMEAEG